MAAKAWKGNTLPFIGQAVRVVDRPELSPLQLANQSNMLIEWQCVCGQTFMRRMHGAAEYGIRCKTCSRSGTSRLEFEVAALLQAYFPNLTIHRGYTHSSYYKLVDLYVQELDAAIELDPYHTHYKKTDSDLRITRVLETYFTHVIRVRDERLQPILMSLPISVGSMRLAQEWVQVILTHSLFQSHLLLDDEQIEQALIKGNTEWDQYNTKGVQRPASDVEDVEISFIRNLDRPGRKPAYTSMGSNDLCEWKCFKCGDTYNLTMQRFVKGTRCPKELGEKLRVLSMSNPKFPKLIDTHPEIFRQLVKNEEYPYFDIRLTNKNLRQDCLWRCNLCGYEWISKPYVRIKQPSLGCRNCTWGK